MTKKMSWEYEAAVWEKLEIIKGGKEEVKLII